MDTVVDGVAGASCGFLLGLDLDEKQTGRWLKLADAWEAVNVTPCATVLALPPKGRQQPDRQTMQKLAAWASLRLTHVVVGVSADRAHEVRPFLLASAGEWAPRLVSPAWAQRIATRRERDDDAAVWALDCQVRIKLEGCE